MLWFRLHVLCYLGTNLFETSLPVAKNVLKMNSKEQIKQSFTFHVDGLEVPS